MARGKPGDLQVVVHQAAGFDSGWSVAAEELLLIVVARPPREHERHVERSPRICRIMSSGQHAFGRVLIVRAAGGVDVVIAGDTSRTWRIDPPQLRLEQARHGARDARRDRVFGHVLGPALYTVR